MGELCDKLYLSSGQTGTRGFCLSLHVQSNKSNNGSDSEPRVALRPNPALVCPDCVGKGQ